MTLVKKVHLNTHYTVLIHLNMQLHLFFDIFNYRITCFFKYT